MSSTITLDTGEEETIHGTYDAAKSYLGMMLGDPYTTWRAFDTDDQKRTLAMAVRYLNQQAWAEDADTFAERDAIAAFATAEYELAAILSADQSAMTALDAGSNIQSVSASGASVTYFAPTSAGRGATKLPPVLQRLIGSYLAASGGAVTVGGYAATGSSSSPFSECADDDRTEPY